MHSEATNPDSGRGPWARVVSAPQVGALSAASILARMPFGMGGISLVIFVHSRTGSFGVAGLVTGIYTLAFALAGPLLGRQIDRRGPRPVLAPASVVSALGLVAVAVIGEGSAATVPLVLAAAVAGASVPPVSGVLRRTWPALIPREDLTTAYLFDSVLIEIVFLCGPLLTGLLAAAVDPVAPLLVGAAFVLFGTAWFLLVPVVRAERPTAAPRGSLAGALASPTIRYITLAGLPLGASFGALDVALPAFGSAHGSSALGGLFVASLSVGSMLGAVAFGLLATRLGMLREASLRLAVYQPVVIAPLLLATSPAVLVPLAVIAGSFAAPMLTLRSRVAELTMPDGTGTETFTWLLLAVMVGASASSALAGPLIEAGGWRVGVVQAVAVPLVALPALFAGRRLLPEAGLQHG
ncbi:MAG TPA: MFS transporter [Solirubrobacterales bacterium]|nr:MFS transporter [Solirubrobacterales bacterium]